MEANSSKNIKDISIDKILCSIKEKGFDEKIIKKDLSIDIIVKKYYSQENAIIEFEGKKHVIEP